MAIRQIKRKLDGITTPSTIMPPPTCGKQLARPLSQRVGKH